MSGLELGPTEVRADGLLARWRVPEGGPATPESAQSAWGTFVDLTRWRAEQHPERVACTFIPDERSQPNVAMTYAELDREARAVAAGLQRLGVERERVVLLLPPGRAFLIGFLAVWYAGAVAIPTFPPRPGVHLSRLHAVLRDARPRVVVTTTAILDWTRAYAWDPEMNQGVDWQTITELGTSSADEWRPPSNAKPETPAFLQYTSGTTGAPKGVVVTHANVIHNMELIRAGFATDDAARVVSWLPPYHDMGLVGGMLHPIYVGGQGILMSPGAFLKRPLRWLEMISTFRANVSGAPNFAYDYCVDKIAPSQRKSLDLSSWELAFNGAEPVRKETLCRFADAFAPVGFRARAFYPCYGLAEATLMVTGGRRLAGATVRHFDDLELNAGRAFPVDDTRPHARAIVSCGFVLGGQSVVVVDPETGVPCQSGAVGEVQISGPSGAAGYWQNPAETQRVFGALLPGTESPRYLRTGDLGFLLNDELYITGRAKDLIIIRGANHHPQDIEQTVQGVSRALRVNRGVAFPFTHGSTEALAIVQELDPGNHDGEALLEAVNRAVVEEHGLQPAAVLLVPRGHIPLTSSGKLQRQAVKANFLRGTIEPMFSCIWGRVQDRQAAILGAMEEPS